MVYSTKITEIINGEKVTLEDCDASTANPNLTKTSMDISDPELNSDGSPIVVNDSNELQQHQNINNFEDNWNFVSHKKKKINKVKIPPIQIDINKDAAAMLHNSIKTTVKPGEFTIDFKNNGKGARIYPSSSNAASQIKNTLKSKGFEFHSYLSNDDKNKCFIIKGINTNFGFTTEDIFNELVRAGLPDSIKVSEHITGYNKSNPNVPHLFRLLVPFNFNTTAFKQIKSIFGVAIQFSSFVKKSTTQCSNCQQYFHTAAACQKKYKCVKCIANHLPGCCDKSDNSLPQCVNCNGFHTANNQPNCDYYKKFIIPILNKKNPKTTINSTNINNANNDTTNNVSSNSNNINGSVNHKNNTQFNSNTKVSYADTVKKSKNSNNNNNNENNNFGKMFDILCKMEARFTIIENNFNDMSKNVNNLMKKVFSNENGN